jgi:hypothetical protein
MSSTVAFGFFLALGIWGSLCSDSALRLCAFYHAQAAVSKLNALLSRKKKVSAECGDSSLMEPNRNKAYFFFFFAVFFAAFFFIGIVASWNLLP